MKRYANKVFTPVVLLMLFIFAAITFLSLRQANEARAAAAMVTHSQEVLTQVAKIISVVTDNETGSRGYIITGDTAFLEPLQHSRKNVNQQIELLRKLTLDNASQQQRVDSLAYYARKKMEFSDSTISLKHAAGMNTMMHAVARGNGKFYMDAIRLLGEEMQHEEDRLLTERKIRHEKATLILNSTIITIIIVIIALLFILLRKDYLAIRAREKAETALKKTEASFQLMTDSVKDYAIVMLDPRGCITSWNKGAERVNGYEKQEIIGKSIDIFYTPPDLAGDEPRRNLALAKKYGQFETEGPRLRKDGQPFWANVVLIALVNEDNGLDGYATITRDITERKKTQEQLEFLSRQINQSNDAILVTDVNARIISWNRGAEILYGFTSREMLEKDPNEMLRTALSKAEIDSLLKKIARENYWSGELKRKTKSGQDIVVRSSITTIRDGRDNITGHVAVSFDITAQKKLREEVNHLVSLVEQSVNAIISVDPDNRIISWNASAEKLFGYARQEVLGRSAEELSLTHPSGNLTAAITDVFRQGTRKSEMNFLHRNGQAFTGALHASIIRNHQEEPGAVAIIIQDITLQKQLETQMAIYSQELESRVKQRTEEVYTNEQRFRALIENSAEGIALLDQKGTILYRSPSADKITGSQPIGKALGWMHPDDREFILDKGREALEKPGVPVAWQGRCKHASGGYIWVEGTFTNLLEVKAVNAIVANYRDISNRKIAENKLIASEERFRYTLDNMLEGVQIIGFDWRYLYVNDAVTRHGRYSREALLGHTMKEIYPGIEHSEMYRTCQRCFDERISFQLENEFVYPDNSIAWFELSIQPVPEGLFILSVDITDRKNAEQRLVKSEQLYRSLFENMLHGFAYCRAEFENGKLADYIHLGVNREFEMVTGLQQVTWKKCSELIPGFLQSCPEYAGMIERVAMKGSSEKMDIYMAPLGRWFSIAVYSPEKEYFVILADNITDRRQSEQQLKLLNVELEERVARRTEQLRKTNEELEAFSYSVSHDLRAPLRAIIGFTAILEHEYSSRLDDEARRITGIIKSNTLRMGRLIDDLLTFSRMGRQDMLKTRVSTNQMIQEILQQPEIQQLTQEHAIRWFIPELPDMHADSNTIRQVWINLISNAVKYSGKTGTPEIAIGSFSRGGDIVFFVKDNGVGFDEKYKNKLFRVFQRLHGTEEFEGTGIGLAIVEKIIARHEGSVWAEGEIDKGACFYFSLPEENHDAASGLLTIV